ncbi:alkaline phosphatase D family protein [Croceibacterium ferulae]|uniref:alkaline phosphatase D family protein n=1 Tax=Croceibacterium ferulae TaxID=1854641 RepID=UPI000EB29D87|nr:alkaline phosphatase D family protein [Croceibacterium ferulae]
MTFTIDRRRLVLGAGAGLAALTLPGGVSLAQGLLAARGFTHGLASGEPAADSMLLWTRFVPGGNADAVRLTAEMATDAAFAKVVAGGSVQTGGWRDWTAKLTVTGLRPGTTYYYRFIAPDGTISATGRTRTLPVGPVSRFGLGVFSCSNLPVGHFNAYGHAALRGDMDLWLHLGDYIYESGRPQPDAANVLAARVLALEPAHEILALADYRMRLACYRADPDLQRLHQLAPMIAQWDDHESANDSWEGGAGQHQPDEGEWSARKAAAMQAYREWMPVSDEPWKTYAIGDLATLYRTESRLLGRTRQIDMAPALAAGDPAALAAFRDGPWQDPAATMLGFAQEAWLADALARNARSTAWQLVGMGTITGRTSPPPQIVDWLRPDTAGPRVAFWRDAIRAGRAGIPMWMDRWDGYPAARARMLAAAQAADADLVMLAGDSHNAWAFQLAHDGRPAGVEFAGQAVSSNGVETGLAVDPAIVARGFVAANAELRWCDTSRRGYMMIDLTPQRVTGEWQFLNTVAERDLTLAGTHRMSVERGRRIFAT